MLCQQADGSTETPTRSHFLPSRGSSKTASWRWWCDLGPNNELEFTGGKLKKKHSRNGVQWNQSDYSKMGQNRVQGVWIKEFWDGRVEEAPLCQLNGRSPSSGRLLRLFEGRQHLPTSLTAEPLSTAVSAPPPSTRLSESSAHRLFLILLDLTCVILTRLVMDGPGNEEEAVQGWF